MQQNLTFVLFCVLGPFFVRFVATVFFCIFGFFLWVFFGVFFGVLVFFWLCNTQKNLQIVNLFLLFLFLFFVVFVFCFFMLCFFRLFGFVACWGVSVLLLSSAVLLGRRIPRRDFDGLALESTGIIKRGGSNGGGPLNEKTKSTSCFHFCLLFVFRVVLGSRHLLLLFF